MGEIVPFGGEASGVAVREFIGRMGWEGSYQYDPKIKTAYRPSVRLLAWGQAPWLQFATRWRNVDRLTEQAWRAWRQGLDVAAAVTVRVATEEAIRNALEDLKAVDWEKEKAAKREILLFDSYLTKPTDFEPLDHAATRAALSGIRGLGNDAAHAGVVTHAAKEDALLRLLGQALMSLSAAVSARV